MVELFNSLCTCSMASADISAIVWLGELKCKPIGVSFLILILDLWSVNRAARDLDVSPTYWMLHCLHVIRYTV